MLRRRSFLVFSASTALFAVGCRRPPPTRPGVLTALVREVVVPDTAAVAETSLALERAVHELARAPSLGALRAARARFSPALLAWKRAQSFRAGPIVETSALVRSTFWPARPAAIEGMLADTAVIDEASIANLGADARGLYAIEYLLFPLERDEAAACRGLAANVASYADGARKALGDGTTYANRFAQGGQLSLSTLVQQMIETVETLLTNRLELVLGLERSHMLKPHEIEGWPSGTSHEIVLAQLGGSERLYRGADGGGIADLARTSAPTIAESVTHKYTAAIESIRGLGAPIERVVTTDRAKLEAAAAATKALELALKVDLASALGVTITFQAGDGD
jgi:uncharacterized protein